MEEKIHQKASEFRETALTSGGVYYTQCIPGKIPSGISKSGEELEARHI